MKTNEGGAAFGAIGKERSKLLAMVLVISMVFAGLAVVTSGMGTSDAEPQGEAVSDYQSLKTAFTTGGAYYLGGDITIEQSSDLEVTAEVILDLNGHSLNKTFEQQNNFLIVISNGSLTINDSGTNGKISSADYGIQLRSNSSLTLNGGAIETVQEAIDLYTSVSNVDVLISGGSVTSTEDSVMNVRGSTGINVQITGGEMVSNGRTAFYVSSYQENAIAISMTSGSVEHNNGRSGAFQIYSGAHVTIGGDATISADYVALQLQAGVSSSTLDITGGTISSESRTGAILSTEDDATLTISGGEFNSPGVVLDASEDSIVVIDGSGVEISGELSGNATLTVNNGASMAVVEELEMSSTSKIVNDGTIDFEVTPEGAQDSNLTGSGIIIGYEGEGFADSIKVGGESISADGSNFEQIITSMNENPGMFTGITQVTVTEDVTITDLVQIPEGINVSTDYVFIVDPVDEDSDVGVILMSGATFTGTIRMADKTEVVATDLMAESELIIRFGSICFDGTVESGSAVLTSYNGEDVNITGFLKSGVQIIVVQGTEGIDVPMRFDRFDEGEGQVLFKAFGSEETTSEIPDWVDAIYAGSVTIGGLTITNNATYFYDGTSQYPDQMTVYVSGIISQGFINKDRSGIATSDFDLGVYTIRDGELVLTDAFNAGTYYVYYGYFVDGVLHPYLCEWEIWGIDAVITIDEISKAYDGTIDVVSGYTLPNDVPNVTFGAPVYDDEYVGENKIVTIPITFAAGSVPENYFFLVNDQYQQVWGDSTSGYYIVLEGAITQREITIDITVDVPEDNPIVKEYDGTEFEYIFSSNDVTGVSGDILTLTVTTTGSNAGTYTGSGLEYVCVVDNGELEVTDSYIVTYSSNNYLTIDEKDITISPAPDRDITKVYNGYSSRIMDLDDFIMDGVVGDEEVSFALTQDADHVKYNSPNVSEANTLTVTGFSLVGDEAVIANYEIITEEVVFDDEDEYGSTVGITPFVLGFSEGETVSIDKTYDGTVDAPVGDITSEDYTVSASQAGAQPIVTVTAAVYGSADAETSKIVYITGIDLSNNDHENFALPDKLVSGEIQYYFSITGENVKIDPITVTTDMIYRTIVDTDGQIVLTVTVTSGDQELTGFISTLTYNNTPVTGSENSYVITEAGRYTATIVSVSDTNWSGSNVTRPFDVSFDYTADFYTKDTIDGGFALEQTVFFDNGRVLTPNATNVPDGYELVGWETSDGTRYDVGVYAPISAIGTDFYAVYEEIGDDPSDPSGPTVTIDMPDSFAVGEEIEFSVSTTKGDYTGGFVQGTGIFEGIPGVDYIIWYKEVNDGQWYLWEDGNFGPSGGFPLIDTTSEFKIQFINAGIYDLTVQIVTVEGGDVVCETTAVVDVPAEHSLAYHIQDAVEYTYVDNGEYNANAYTYAAEFTSYANSIIANYGHEYYEALIAYMTNGTESDKAASVMNDFARYMGALYRSSDGDVGRVYFNSNEYVWKVNDKGAWNHGSNWQDVDGDSLVEDVKDYIAATQNTRIVMEIAVPGGERQALTYGAVFEDAPAPEVQYYDVTIEGEGVAIYIDGLRYFPGTYSMVEGEHTIGVEVLSGYTGTPVISNVTDGKFTVSGEMTIAIDGVTAVVDPEPEMELPGIEFDMPVFTAGQDDAFRVTFIANDYVGDTVTVKAIFGGEPGDITSIRYWNVNNNSWDTMVAEADGSYVYGGSGFQLSDATSAFRATFANAGVYTLTVYISIGGAEITSATETFIVEEPAVVSEHTVLFVIDENVGVTIDPMTVASGVGINLPVVSVEGYTFSGWMIQGGNSSIIYNGYYVPNSNVVFEAVISEDDTSFEPVYYNVILGSTTYSKLADSPVGLPSMIDGREITGWSTTSGTYTGVYYVNPADAVEGTITLTPIYADEEETYDIRVNLTGAGASESSYGTPVRDGNNFYLTVYTPIGYQIGDFTAKIGETVLGMSPVTSIDRHTVTFLIGVTSNGDVEVDISIEPNNVSDNITVSMEAAMDSSENEGVYIELDSNSDVAYLPVDATLTITYYYSYVDDSDSSLHIGVRSTDAITVENSGESISQALFIDLGLGSNYKNPADADQFAEGNAYWIVAEYRYGESTVISNTVSPAYVES